MDDKDRSRGWCITLNNWTEDELKNVWVDKAVYQIIGKEVGEEGTPHLQGYVYLKDAKTLASMKRLVGARCHLEIAAGNAGQNREYCSKDGDYEERGKCPKQGKRVDLEKLAQMTLSEGLDAVRVAHPGQYIQWNKGLKALAYDSIPKRTKKPRVVWLWGKAGTGKTREAVGEDYSRVYIKSIPRWWDGYRGEPRVVMDDVAPGLWKETEYRDFLMSIDRYPYLGEVKCGTVSVPCDEIYITCEHPPAYFWSGNKLDQVTRRLDEVREVCTEVSTEVRG